MASSSTHVREHASCCSDCAKFHCVYLPLHPLRDIWADTENLPIGSTSYILQLNSFLFTPTLESQQESVCDQHGRPVSILGMTKQLQSIYEFPRALLVSRDAGFQTQDNGMVSLFTWKWDYSQGCRNSLSFNIPSDSQNILIAYWETIGKFPYV